jgi:hypothetical protein
VGAFRVVRSTLDAFMRGMEIWISSRLELSLAKCLSAADSNRIRIVIHSRNAGSNDACGEVGRSLSLPKTAANTYLGAILDQFKDGPEPRSAT